MVKKWIKGAIKHPGALHRALITVNAQTCKFSEKIITYAKKGP